MGLFSFLKQTAKTILVFHNDVMQVLQFDLKNGEPELVGFSELSLTKGVIEEGEIAVMDVFKDVLTELFAQAKPKAIRTKKLYVNIPYHFLYTFVEDFSHKVEEASLKQAILTTVSGQCPIPVEDLTLDFAMTEKEHKISYAAYAFPKKWQQRFTKACKEVGVDSVEFIPEPIGHMALNEKPMQEDAALFASHGDRIYLTLFRNGLLYDSYFLGQLGEDGLMDCSTCFAEYHKAQKAFTSQFGDPIQALYFIGFQRKNQNNIKKSFEAANQSLVFIDPKRASLSKLLPYELGKDTLFGLFNVVVSRESI